MEQRKHWWNSRWGRLARRDVFLRADADRWYVEARLGGAEGTSRFTEHDTEDAAYETVRGLLTGPGEWRELVDRLPVGGPAGPEPGRAAGLPPGRAGNRTAMGPTTTDPAPSITPGMRVIDAAGRPVGRVHAVRPGDPNAVTVQGGGAPDPVGARIPHPEAGDEPEVAPDLAARLLRAGYVEVRTNGPAGAGYVEPVQVAGVRGDVVTLAVA